MTTFPTDSTVEWTRTRHAEAQESEVVESVTGIELSVPSSTTSTEAPEEQQVNTIPTDGGLDFWDQPRRVAAVVVVLNLIAQAIVGQLLGIPDALGWELLIIAPLFFFGLWNDSGFWRYLILFSVVVGLFTYGGELLAMGDMVGFVGQLAYSGPMLVLLIGTAPRSMTIPSFMIFIGSLVMTLLLI